MKMLINWILSVIIILTASLASSSEKIYEEEKKVVTKIKKDIFLMLEILGKSSEYLEEKKGVRLFNELMTSIDSLKGGYNHYYSSSLGKNKFFKKCLVGALYTGIEDYGNLLIEYNSCHLKRCAKNALNRDLVILQERHIRKLIGICQAELNSN